MGKGFGGEQLLAVTEDNVISLNPSPENVQSSRESVPSCVKALRNVRSVKVVFSARREVMLPLTFRAARSPVTVQSRRSNNTIFFQSAEFRDYGVVDGGIG